MQSPWRLDQHQATLELGPLGARVDLNCPATGLCNLTLAGHDLPFGLILSLSVPESLVSVIRPVDGHVRGHDLIATYTDATQQALRWQIYWRASSDRFPGALAAIEAIVSAQTALLDSQPRSRVSSALPSGGALIWHANASGELQLELVESGDPTRSTAAETNWSCFGIRLPDELGTYVEMVHPDDFSCSKLTEYCASVGPDGWSIMHRLFDRTLEKGVILRSRILGLFFKEQPTAQQIADLKQRFAAEPLPLTT